MGIKIVSDRMIDLPKSELEALNIDTISCYVNMNGKSYSDLDDVFPEDIFRYMDETGKVAQTAAKSPQLYAEFFKQFVDQGLTVIHFAVSSGISSIAEHAKAAAEGFPGQVYVIDTLMLSNGIALLVKYALQLIADGETDASKIVALVRRKIPKVQTAFLIDDLECLYKGGRCSGLMFHAANILKIRPVIYMDEMGRMMVREKLRGSRQKALELFFKHTFEQLAQPDLDQLYVLYSTYNEAIERLILDIVPQYYAFKNITFNKAGCNCSIHCGKDAIALFYLSKE